MVSPRVGEVVIQQDEQEQAELEGRARGKALNDLPRTLISLVGIGADEG